MTEIDEKELAMLRAKAAGWDALVAQQRATQRIQEANAAIAKLESEKDG